MQRRELLKMGMYGFGGLSLSQFMQARAYSTELAAQPGMGLATADNRHGDRTAIILVWQRGGCSHLDTWDPKPDAPSEFRGPYQSLETNVPGMRLTELLPQLSKCADKYSLLRSVAHTGGGHPAGSLQILAGDPDAKDKTLPVLPDWMSIANYLRHNPKREIPNYITVNPVDRYDSFTIAGSTYLGPSHDPFRVVGDPSQPDFKVPNIGIGDEGVASRFKKRLDLKRGLDRVKAEIDQAGVMEAMNDFDRQALNLLTSPKAQAAFDLSREKESVRERYGKNQWGQQLLMARRLVEAGVEIVTTELDGPLCGRVANWDDHAVNHHVFDALDFRMPTFDQSVSALIEDVYDRGLDRRVLVVVAGEFGRTPRISNVASSGGGVASGTKGTVQPGRDHWPRANTMLFAGGGIQTGQIIGATDARGEDPVERRVSPGDFLATLYNHLGLEAARISVPDQSGRPIPILPRGKVISELT
ncbi:DUF1501 domain-containing protein [Pirellulaceae bacterium]|jgi:hypothetical protein|nr:DUF1501 domain-containing protein [Pirellulaceae bacterium]